MNMPPSNFGDTSEKKQVTFYDDESRPILTVVSSSEYTIHHPDGSETEVKDSQFIQTVTGQTVHTSALFGPNALQLGVCWLCRRPPWSLFGRSRPTTHGLVLIGKERGGARRCQRCKRLLCGQHQQWVAGRPYCVSPCAGIAKRKRLFRKIFFKLVED